MKYALVVILYLLSVLAFMQGWLLAAAAFALIFSLRYGAFVFIPTAVALDGYYGLFHTIPVLSLCAVIGYGVIEFLRPKLTGLVF